MHPLKLLNKTTDASTVDGIPKGMTTALQAFIDAYRTHHPYDATGTKPAARLTIDVAAGDRWLIALNRKATAGWLLPGGQVLDYANAMVPARQPSSATDAQANWKEHVTGKPQYAPPVPAPIRFPSRCLRSSSSDHAELPRLQGRHGSVSKRTRVRLHHPFSGGPTERSAVNQDESCLGGMAGRCRLRLRFDNHHHLSEVAACAAVVVA